MSERDDLMAAFLQDQLVASQRRRLWDLLEPAEREALWADYRLVQELRRSDADQHPERLADRLDHLLDHDRRSARLRTADAVERRLPRRWSRPLAGAILVALALLAALLLRSEASTGWQPGPGWRSEQLLGTDWVSAPLPVSRPLTTDWRLLRSDGSATVTIRSGGRVAPATAPGDLALEVLAGTATVAVGPDTTVTLTTADAQTRVTDARLDCRVAPDHQRFVCHRGSVLIRLDDGDQRILASNHHLSVGPGIVPIIRDTDLHTVICVGLEHGTDVALVLSDAFAEAVPASGADLAVVPVLALEGPTAFDLFRNLARRYRIWVISRPATATGSEQALVIGPDGQRRTAISDPGGPAVFATAHGRLAVFGDPQQATEAALWQDEPDLLILPQAAAASDAIASRLARKTTGRPVIGLVSGYRTGGSSGGAAIVAGGEDIDLAAGETVMVVRYHLPIVPGSIFRNTVEDDL